IRVVQLIIGRCAGAVAGAAWLMIAARSLEVAAFGRLAVLIAVGTVLGVLTEAGMPLLVVEEVARDGLAIGRVVRGALRVRLTLTAIGVAILTGVGVALGQPLAALLYGLSLLGS